MSLFRQFPNYSDLKTSTAFDSPITMSSLSPFNSSGGDCLDHLATIDFSAISSSAPTSATFSLSPSSVERILQIPQYSPITPPERSHLPISSPSASITSNNQMSAITTSVIVPNSSLSSSTTATMSRSTGGKVKSSSTATSSTVSTIVMKSNSSNGNGSSSSNVNQQQSCLVCGDIPLGKNFGVVTCGSCKIFFRRNNPADKTKLQCRNNNRCTITKANRRNCAACRLRKCIDLGMRVKQSKQPKVRNSEASDESPVERSSRIVEESGFDRLHSRSSTSEDDDGGFEDMPSLIPVEEAQTRLQSRVEQQTASDDLLEEVNNVILSHIREEQQSPTGQLEQLVPGIENLNSSNETLVATNSTNKLYANKLSQLTAATSSTSATIEPFPTPYTSNIGHGFKHIVSPPSVKNYDSSLCEVSEHEPSFEANTVVSDQEEEEEAEESDTEKEDQFFSNMPFDEQTLSATPEGELNYESSSSAAAVHQVQPCTHDPVYLNGPGSCPIDLDSPECIERARQMRVMHFQQHQQPILGCGFQGFQAMYDPQPKVSFGFSHSSTYRQRSSDEGDENEYYIHDGNALLHQRHKRLHEGDNETGMELVKAEAKNLGSREHIQISELCRLTSTIRIKLGIEYKTQLPDYQLHAKEKERLNILNGACRMIDFKPNTSAHLCTHVYDSLRHGIFYANKTFKIFEEFWLQNREMRDLIHQDETGFDRKRNNLLHMLYHLRGVYNFDESQNAWAVMNGMNENTFTYIKLTMFNESIKKEMTSKHHQYIQSFPKEWRQDPTVFNLMTYMLIYGAFEEMHSQSKLEKIRYYSVHYLVQQYFEHLYKDKARALQMLYHMLKLISDLSPLCTDCLNACTHSLNPKELEKIGPNYAACLMLEMKQKKRDEEHRRRRKHSRHSESSDVSSRDRDPGTGSIEEIP